MSVFVTRECHRVHVYRICVSAIVDVPGGEWRWEGEQALWECRPLWEFRSGSSDLGSREALQRSVCCQPHSYEVTLRRMRAGDVCPAYCDACC
eukprot:jgi/Botrbrau1/23624/Bobra.55_2s0015.1